jgi:prepilin-type N-terminal cleavage/methylation domain-containing protein
VVTARACDEDGFTLVELAVSVMILAVGILGLVGVSHGSFEVAGSASTRSKAIAIATQKLEELRAIPYKNLPTGSLVTTEDVLLNNVRYHVERTVTDVADGTITKAYKSTVVAVSWIGASGSHEVHQSSYVYPGGIGPANAATKSSGSNGPAYTPAASATLLAASPTDPAQQPTVIDLLWTYTSTCAASTFIVQYSTNDFASSNEVTRGATTLAYRVTGLTPSTTYKFRVAARSAAGQQSGWSPVATATTTAAAPPACQVGAATITPAAVEKKSASGGSGLEMNPVVQLSTQGPCNGYRAVYQPTLSTSRTTLLAAGVNGSYSAALQGTSVPWDVGKRYVDIHDNFTNVKVASVLLTVCDHNVSTCA